MQRAATVFAILGTLFGALAGALANNTRTVFHLMLYAGPGHPQARVNDISYASEDACFEALDKIATDLARKHLYSCVPVQEELRGG